MYVNIENIINHQLSWSSDLPVVTAGSVVAEKIEGQTDKKNTLVKHTIALRIQLTTALKASSAQRTPI